MRRNSKREAFALNAIRLVLDLLASLPDSTERADAIRDAHACEHEVKHWSTAPPTDADRAGMMRRVLTLHLIAAKLRRAAHRP